jgi:hypothetical protein
MNKEISKIDHICHIADAIIATPSLSIEDFGINNSNKELMFTSGATAIASQLYPALIASSAAYIGTSAIVGASTLSGIGIIGTGLLAGTGAAAAGASSTGVGLAIAPVILAGGVLLYRKKKKEQAEKNRAYKEIIAKHQATINRQREINRELEKRLRVANMKNSQQQKEIAEMKKEIENLKQLIELLEDQRNNFKAA